MSGYIEIRMKATKHPIEAMRFTLDNLVVYAIVRFFQRILDFKCISFSVEKRIKMFELMIFSIWRIIASSLSLGKVANNLRLSSFEL